MRAGAESKAVLAERSTLISWGVTPLRAAQIPGIHGPRKDIGTVVTVLTLNVFRQSKGSAVDTAKRYIDQVAAKYKAEKWAKTVGGFEELGCLFKVTDSAGTP